MGKTIRSNGSKWNPLDGLRKITQGDSEFVGIVIESEDAYNWNVFYSGYYHDVNNCKIIKENEFTAGDVYELVSNTTLNQAIDTLKEEFDSKLETITNKFNDYTNTKTLDTKLADKANKTHTHTMDEITNLAFPIPGVDEIVGLQSELNSLSMRINDAQDMVMDSVEMNYAKIEHTHITSEITDLKQTMLNMMYPVGSIYTSMQNTSPATLFGGTWTQITDRFLYCTTTSKQTGGSKKITIANLPAHNHTATCSTAGAHTHKYATTSSCNFGSNDKDYRISTTPDWEGTTQSAGNHTHTISINNTGSGTDYMPPYITVYAWYRTA